MQEAHSLIPGPVQVRQEKWQQKFWELRIKLIVQDVQEFIFISLQVKHVG